MSAPIAEDKNVLDEAWDSVVGGLDWVKSVIIGEFADKRPLSALITDMLVSFVPGVVILTSGRDALAVTLRLAKHPEKRDDTMEWVVLCACLITIALPLAMAAGGAVALGVGAIVGGIAGSELGAALRAVMLLLAREGAKLVELIQFLQKFISGNIMGFLRAVKFIQYEKVLIQALSKITGKLTNICKSVRLRLEQWLKAAEESSAAKWIGERTDLLKNSGAVTQAKATIAKLADWERRFYGLQQDAIKQVPLALAELDARLTKVLAQTAPKEAHTVASGVQADKVVAAVPPKQMVRDVPGRAIAKAEDKVAAAAPKASKSAAPQAKPATSAKAEPPPPPKEKPDPIKPPDEGKNNKKQETADAEMLANREKAAVIKERIGADIKNHPLRQAYEAEVAALSKKSEALLESGMTKEEVARQMAQERRDLGVKYKDLTAEPLRDYIYEINQARYGDPLGPKFDKLVADKVKKGVPLDDAYQEIINSSSTSNADINKLLSKFEEWLQTKSPEYLDAALK